MAKRVLACLLLPLLAGCPDNIGQGLQITDPPGLAAPSGLYATVNGGSQVDIIWTDNSTAETGFRLEVNSSGFQPSMPITDFKILPPNTSSYSYPAFPDRIYYFRLIAITDLLESEASNVFTVQTPNVPRRVENVGAVALSSTAIVVTWTDGFGETGYMISMSADGGMNWNPVVMPPADVGSATVGSLTPDTLYLFRVYALNSVGGSTESSTVGATTLPP